MDYCQRGNKRMGSINSRIFL